MYMQDWVGRLDAFLQFNEEEILHNKGKVTAAIAKTFAENEFEKFRVLQDVTYRSDFDRLVADMEKNKKYKKHPNIDGIIVSCLEGWEDTCGEGDVVIIHDAVRPMVSGDIISDCIVTCKRHGNGLSAIRCQETIVQTNDGMSGSVNIHRDDIMRVMTPQAYRYERALWAHRIALERGTTMNIVENLWDKRGRNSKDFGKFDDIYNRSFLHGGRLRVKGVTRIKKCEGFALRRGVFLLGYWCETVRKNMNIAVAGWDMWEEHGRT